MTDGARSECRYRSAALPWWSGPLGRLRVVGLAEGLSYLVLLLIAMPLKYFAGLPLAVLIAGSLHGALFILFILSLGEVTIRRPWWSPRFWLIALGASLIPGGTFGLDHWLRGEQAADAAQLSK